LPAKGSTVPTSKERSREGGNERKERVKVDCRCDKRNSSTEEVAISALDEGNGGKENPSCQGDQNNAKGLDSRIKCSEV